MQQALAQVIGPLFEPHLSTHSDGCRPGRRAQMALEEMAEAHGENLRDAADCDLKSFFDTVHHGLLMDQLARRIADRRVLRLIGRSLRAGVILPDGRREPTPGGVPQGGPLAPLLAHVMLDDVDAELARRGLRFARYADDFLIFVRSQRAAPRVLGSIRRFLKGRLRRQIKPDQHQGRTPERVYLPWLRAETRHVAWDRCRSQTVQGAYPCDDQTEQRAEQASPHRGSTTVCLRMAQLFRLQSQLCGGGRIGPMAQTTRQAVRLETVEAAAHAPPPSAGLGDTAR